MKLVDFAFKAMKNKEKDIELRLNDEKRRRINIDDIIIFTHVDTGE
jgi:ASC-1-like (ASCH) protein